MAVQSDWAPTQSSWIHQLTHLVEEESNASLSEGVCGCHTLPGESRIQNSKYFLKARSPYAAKHWWDWLDFSFLGWMFPCFVLILWRGSSRTAVLSPQWLDLILPRIPLMGHMMSDGVINPSKQRRERPGRHITSEDWAADSQLIYLPISPHYERWIWFSSYIL